MAVFKTYAQVFVRCALSRLGWGRRRAGYLCARQYPVARAPHRGGLSRLAGTVEIGVSAFVRDSGPYSERLRWRAMTLTTTPPSPSFWMLKKSLAFQALIIFWFRVWPKMRMSRMR